MRLSALDSCRGIAAASVVLTHYYVILTLSCQTNIGIIDYSPLVFLFKGARFSVIFFFVLSGFVLALPYFNGTQHNYAGYVIRRVCRIYIPYVATVFLAALLCLWLATPRPDFVAQLGSFVQSNWSVPLTPGLLLAHLTMLGVQDKSISLDVPIWSLIVEMRVSLVFPLLVIIVREFGWTAIIGAIAMRLVCLLAMTLFENINARYFYLGDTWQGSLLMTLSHVPFFMFGILIAARMEFFKKAMRKIPAVVHWCLILGLIGVSAMVGIKECGGLPDEIYGIAGAYFICCCLAFGNVQRVLSFSLFAWLGRISYSLYLVHLPVLLAAIYFFHAMLSLPAILAVALPLILITADIMNRLVERPSMRFGKKLAVRLTKSR